MDPSSQQLKNERSRYYVFREQTNTLATKLLESYNQYYSVHGKISESYQVNSEAGDLGVISKDIKKLKESYDLLINNTLPAINSKIDSLSSQIRAAEQREEKEAEKKAEEEKAKAEAKQYERI
jgi:hypothetical protein